MRFNCFSDFLLIDWDSWDILEYYFIKYNGSYSIIVQQKIMETYMYLEDLIDL